MHSLTVVILPEGYTVNDKPSRIYGAANDLLFPYAAYCKTEDDPDYDEERIKYDWWAVGGRWYGLIQGAEEAKPPGCLVGLFCRGKDVRDNTVYVRDIPEDMTGVAVLEPDGTWHDEESIGEELSFMAPQSQKWIDYVRSIYAKYPNHVAVACDLHS